MKYFFRVVATFLFLIPFLFPREIQAQDDRWYQYNKIKAVITVNRDTSFDVSETQTYLFHGTYHQGYREIPFRKIDAITNIRVIDGATDEPLMYSRRRLDKTNPSSWGN